VAARATPCPTRNMSEARLSAFSIVRSHDIVALEIAANARPLQGSASRQPVERLRRRIDLVVMWRIGKAEKLIQIHREPRRSFGQVHLTRFETRRLGQEPGQFVTIGA
jgi:hypothetical protein